jgi:diphthine synthase
MTLFLIGLGLGDEKDITVRGLELVKKADVVFLEHYTSILGVNIDRLKTFYGKDIFVAERNFVENEAEERLLKPAKSKNVALLIVGDPFGATTHTDLMLRALKLNVPVEIVHNASILTAVGVVGLELYKYGRTASIPFWEAGFEPETPYDTIKENKARGLHTLCLLDIKVKEQSREELLQKTLTQKPTTINRTQEIVPRFMTINDALDVLLKIERKRDEGVMTPETLVIGVARLGQPTQRIAAGKVTELLKLDFGGPLHSLVVPGRVQVVEEEALNRWKHP